MYGSNSVPGSHLVAGDIAMNKTNKFWLSLNLHSINKEVNKQKISQKQILWRIKTEWCDRE